METTFYILGFLSVVAALCLLIVASPLYCALALVASFFCLAGIFILLDQEFVAAIQVLVYAGAIMVLFLFVIMLLNQRSRGVAVIKWTLPKALGLAIVMGILAQLVSVFSSPASKLGRSADYTAARIAREGAVQVIGADLYTRYVLPFEAISILLMVAVMGAVLIAKRRVEPASEGETAETSSAAVGAKEVAR
jgi:NADH-quinone oxidoreductase subunit J